MGPDQNIVVRVSAPLWFNSFVTLNLSMCFVFTDSLSMDKKPQETFFSPGHHMCDDGSGWEGDHTCTLILPCVDYAFEICLYFATCVGNRWEVLGQLGGALGSFRSLF